MPMRFRLILIYPQDDDFNGFREYKEVEYDNMADLLHYLHSLHAENIHRIIIERI